MTVMDTSPHPAGSPVVERWRAELLDRVLHIIFGLGVATALPSVAFAVSVQRFDIVVVDALAVTVLGAVTFSARLDYRVRAVVLLSTSFVLGVFFISTVGMVGLTYLLVIPVLAAVLLGLRPALVTLALNAVTLAVIGTVATADPRLRLAGFDGIAEWATISLNFLFMDAVMALSCAILLQRIERSLIEEQQLSASLATERSALDARNRALEHEVAERRRAEEHQRFQGQLLDAVGEAVVATDLDGAVRYLNPAAERLYGASASDTLGRPAAEMMASLTGPESVGEIWARVLAGDTWTGELDTTRLDGTTFPALVTIAPYHHDGRVAGVIGVSADITRLRETIDELARSEAIRIAFLRATSHELRTPLVAITGFAETLYHHAGSLDAGRRTQLTERLLTNATRLTALITDLLDVDRLTSGMVVAQRQRQDLRDLVARIADECDTRGRHLQLVLEPVTAEVDGPKLERVVANLIANAARHTAPGGTILVALSRRDDTVLLRVEDNGPGIDPGYLELVFEPFVQGPERHNDAKPGTGLGLSLARELVQLHDGRITASNLPDGGACFEVELPDPSAATS